MTRVFPDAWRAILEDDLAHWRALTPAERRRLEVLTLAFVHTID